MAKTSTRRVAIYINGKEVEASVKQIRAEISRHGLPPARSFAPGRVFSGSMGRVPAEVEKVTWFDNKLLEWEWVE